MSPYDTIVIGAGPAGLTAAAYLARFRRAVLVLDGGPSRASWIPESHNTPGFPSGVAGEVLLARLRTQALEFGAEFRPDMATRLTEEHGVFTVQTPSAVHSAHTAILATGVVDRIPPIAGIEAAIRDSRVRMCPICDAYEAIGRRIAVLGDGPFGAREAEFLRTYSDDVTQLTVEQDAAPAPGVIRTALDDLSFAPAEVVLRRPDGERRFDHLYLALGCAPQADLALACGARQDETGALLVDPHQMTSMTGLYAIGDVSRGLNQIAVATGEAAIAATAIHNRLRAGAEAAVSGAPRPASHSV